MPISARGVYNRTLYRDENTGYTQFSLITRDCDEYKNRSGELICAGNIPVYTKGIPLKIDGEPWQKNGESRIRVSSVQEYSDRAESTISYLANVSNGVGEKTAAKIVGVTGPDIFEFIKRPDAQQVLTKAIPELSAEKASDVMKAVRNTMKQREVYEFIHAFGGEYSHAIKLCDAYGIKALEKIKGNCYEAGIAAGLPFATCDSIARSLGKGAYDTGRISAMVTYALQGMSSYGHVYGMLADVVKEADRIAKHSAFREPIAPPALFRAAYTSANIVLEEGDEIRYFLGELWAAENKIVKEAQRIQNSAHALPFDATHISDIEKRCCITYSENQRRAFGFLRSAGIKILTGGPGTGKTTVVNGLIEAYKMMYPESTIMLCAPTGRAAQRMSEASGMPASTIHRLLDFKPYGNGTLSCRDQNDPLPADFIIVDEMSMADVQILSLLLAAIKNGSLVVLCGDVDQLPSVGPGNVLRDLIGSGMFEVNALDIVYRQANGSKIIQNASFINTGMHSIEEGKDFTLIEASNDVQMHDIISKLVASRFDAADPYKLQVLSSTKKGAAGTVKLNMTIQSICNRTPARFGSGAYQYKVGDKIMMTRNNYELGYYNGDIGIIKSINSEGVTVILNGAEVNIRRGLLSDMVLSYAMTIHKSQGSEYHTVIIALPANPSVMLKRNLLYTAVTRAKSEVIIVYEKGAIDTAIDGIDNAKRRTMLKEKVSGYEAKTVKKPARSRQNQS